MDKPIIAVVFMIALLAPRLALAIPISSYWSVNNLGSFTGDLNYSSGAGGTSATLTIELTNTSPTDNGGYLGAFAFLLPDPGAMTIGSLTATNTKFVLYCPSTGVGASPFTYSGYEPGRLYNASATIGSSWEGMGWAVYGIGAGVTETFTFGITGTNLSNFTSASFTLPTNFLAANFGEFLDGGNDQVAARGGAVPEPGTTLLLGFGLLGLAGLDRKRSRRR